MLWEPIQTGKVWEHPHAVAHSQMFRLALTVTGGWFPTKSKPNEVFSVCKSLLAVMFCAYWIVLSLINYHKCDCACMWVLQPYVVSWWWRWCEVRVVRCQRCCTPERRRDNECWVEVQTLWLLFPVLLSALGQLPLPAHADASTGSEDTHHAIMTFTNLTWNIACEPWIAGLLSAVLRSNTLLHIHKSPQHSVAQQQMH